MAFRRETLVLDREACELLLLIDQPLPLQRSRQFCVIHGSSRSVTACPASIDTPRDARPPVPRNLLQASELGANVPTTRPNRNSQGGNFRSGPFHYESFLRER